jgi:hypothetical protein
MSDSLSFAKRMLPFALASTVLVASMAAHAADVIFYAVAKDEGFDQSSAAAPVPKGNPYRFNAIVGLAAANSINGATVQSLPSGSVYPLVAGIYTFDFQGKFTTLAALNAAAPNGNYRLVIDAVHDGTHTITLPLNGDAYPGTNPHISNFTAAQAVNPAAAFTLTWDAFSGGTTTDFIQAIIADVSGTALFQTPDPGQSGALNGTATSVVIPANTLPAATTLGGQLLIARPVATDSTAYPGVTGFASYYKFTQFGLTTTAVTSAPSRLVAVTAGNPGQFQLQLIGQAGRYVVEASTNLQAWGPLITNTAVGGQFNFTDSQSTNFRVRFYRGRSAN